MSSAVLSPDLLPFLLAELVQVSSSVSVPEVSSLPCSASFPGTISGTEKPKDKSVWEGGSGAAEHLYTPGKVGRSLGGNGNGNGNGNVLGMCSGQSRQRTGS